MLPPQRRSASVRENIRQLIEAKKNRFGSDRIINLPKDKKFFNVTKTKQILDIIPFISSKDVIINGRVYMPKGSLWYEKTYFRHRNVGIANKFVICPQTVGKPCPICEHRGVLKKQGAPKEEIAALYPVERQLFNVIDLEDEAKGVQVLDMPYAWFGQRLEKELNDEDEKYREFYIPEAGYSLIAKFDEGRYMNKPTFKASSITFQNREPYEESIVDQAAVLDTDTIFTILPHAEIKSIFFGVVDEVEKVEPKPEIKAEEPIRRRQPVVPEQEPTPQKPTETDENPCKFGHAFGVDYMKKDECNEDCGDEWELCGETHREQAKRKK